MTSARKYTPEQTQARLEWTRQWRARNEAKIQAYEATYGPRRTILARKRRKADPEKYRKQARDQARKRAAAHALRARLYRTRQLASNPAWNRNRMQRWTAKNPGYWSDIAKRRRLRSAWRAWAATCAASRNHPLPTPTKVAT